MKMPRPKIGTWRGRGAFTLIEVMLASMALVIIIGSVIACNLYGVAMAARQQIWMGASSDSAKAIGTLMDDVRSANTLYVGTYQTNVFTTNLNGVQQSGNALQIFPTTNTTPWTIYYFDTVSNNLDRTNYAGSGQPGSFKLVSANPITNDNNHPIFTEIDYTGRPISNAVSIATVSIYLSFAAVENQQVKIQSGSMFDLYQIITVVTPRL